MSVIFQYAGKAKRELSIQIKPAFDEFEAMLKSQPGFQRARLLVSHPTCQVQILTYWDTYASGVQYNAGAHRELAARLLPLMEDQGTVIASILEAEVAANAGGA